MSAKEAAKPPRELPLDVANEADATPSSPEPPTRRGKVPDKPRRARPVEAALRNQEPPASGLRPPRRNRRSFTPLRMALAGTFLVMVLTGAWLLHLRTQEKAREVLATIPRQAQEALTEGEFREAARLYTRVAEAADRLGRDDAAARGWRQTARESTALADLVGISLHEILEEAAHAAAGAERERWLSLFDGTYRGTWVVIDAPVRRNPTGEAGPRFTVDFPLATAAGAGRLLVEFPAFDQIVTADSGEKRVIFAGQIESCRLIPGSDPVWQIELRAQTAILWGGAETFERLGLPLDDATAKILAEQARALGLES